MDFFIPEQASTFAPRVDLIFYFLTVLTTVITAGIFIALIVIAIKFRRIEGKERISKPLHSLTLELTWTIIPTIVCMGIFAWATWLFAEYLNEPEGGLEIDVVGKQWMWKIQHPNGVREVNSLHVPIGRPIKLTMASQDVLHDFYIPAFRVKQDVIPGRFTRLWFEPTKTGTFHLFCAEYCGTEHSKMIGTVTVMTEADYAEWLIGGPKKSPIEAGEALFTQRGCVSCHNGNSDARCPDLAGVFGETVLLKGGAEAIRDEEYLRESIMEPGKRVVDGYNPLMPSFQNQLTDEDVLNLVAYIKSLEKE